MADSGSSTHTYGRQLRLTMPTTAPHARVPFSVRDASSNLRCSSSSPLSAAKISTF